MPEAKELTDFSSANTALWNFLLEMGAIAGVLLIANVLGRKVPFIRKSLMPTAVLAGFLMLVMRICGLDPIYSATLDMITYHGIALGFIALSLRIPPPKQTGADRLTGPKSGALIVSCYTLQGAIGLVISLGLGYTVMQQFFKGSGVLLGIAYGQGPGQANNIGTMYERDFGFAGGKSFAMSLAAVGYLVACVIGVIYLNVLRRKGIFKKSDTEAESGSIAVDTFQDKGEIPIAESVDRFSLQMALILGVYLLSYFLIHGIGLLMDKLGVNMPDIMTLLWGFNFIVGALLAMLVRAIFNKLRKNKLMTRQFQNNYLLSRFSGFAFDLMIITGIASINIEELEGMWAPFVLMAVAGAVATFLHLRFMCKKLYKDYFYEGFVSMFGMMTGTISSGVLLLREIDPMFTTPAANNLLTGSGTAIMFGAPMLALVSMAPQSDVMSWLVLGILIVYTSLLVLFMTKAKLKEKAHTP
ncbi:MAG: hypothetical protein FWE80_05110 [Oscillospiraceae bacterium]|nr:hypothetical protein [Oscillospiraceae bacterium]